MKKISTGRIIKVDEFRKLNQCPVCRKRIILENKLCDECSKIDIKKCKYCGIILREQGTFKYYAYDIDKDLRNNDSWKTNKKDVHEFIVEMNVTFPKFNDKECSGCNETHERILKNYKKYNKCEFNECENKLLENPSPEELIDYISKNGRICRSCIFRNGFI